MLYICIPTYNEAPTIGVLLWRIRKVFQDYSREYEILVFNDGSTDATAETLEPYLTVLPLTILGGERHVGYSAAIDALCRAAAKRTRYARRDAMIVMQADFTDQPEHLPELVKRFEGGADIVVAESPLARNTPKPVRQLRRVAPWLLKPFVSVPGIADPFGAYRLYRISVMRDLLKASGEAPIVAGDGWAANVDLLLRTVPLARRVEAVSLDSRYDVRARASRVRPLADAMRLFNFGRGASGRRRPPAAVSSASTST